MLKWKLLAALGLSCGFAGVAWGFTQQPSEPGFLELRIYTTLPGQRDALAARFGDYTTKIYERHGIRNVGYWLAASGENADRTFVYMRGYPSRHARDERLSAAHADLEFADVVSTVERDPNTRLIESVRSLDLVPTEVLGHQITSALPCPSTQAPASARTPSPPRLARAAWAKFGCLLRRLLVMRR